MSFAGGVYTLPTSVNPVVTSTTITSNWANTTLNDMVTALSTCLLKDGTQTATTSIPFVQGLSAGSAFVIDSSGNLAVTTNKFTITASSGNTAIGGTLAVTGATTLSAALTYGGVALSNAVTGTGNMVLSASPTFTGTITAAAANFSGSVDVAGAFSVATNKFTVAAASGNTVVAGTLKTATTISVGNATPSASGAGVSFPATQSASTDANTLDDYEEGTWTPSIQGTATYTTQDGTYVKIGSQCWVRSRLTINAIGSGDTGIIGSGLPFANSSITPGYVGFFGTSATNYVFLSCYISNSTVRLTALGAAAAAVTDPAVFFKNGADIIFGSVYPV